MTEGIDILVAGSDTTASSAATAVIQILMNPKVKARLLSSLDAAIPSAAAMPPIVELEKIEYLVRWRKREKALLTSQDLLTRPSQRLPVSKNLSVFRFQYQAACPAWCHPMANHSLLMAWWYRQG